MAEFNLKLKGVEKEDLLSALMEMKAEAEANERELWNNLNDELKQYMFKVADMPIEKQKIIFEFIDSMV